MFDRQLLVHKQRMTTLRDRQPARTSAIIILPMTLSHLAWDDGDIGPSQRKESELRGEDFLAFKVSGHSQCVNALKQRTATLC